MMKLNTTFKRGMEHNYLLVKCENMDVMDYQVRMLTANKIHGVLPLQVKSNDGFLLFQYEISSLKPLSLLFENRQIEYQNLHKIINGLITAFKSVQEYMLDENCIVLEPENVFVDIESYEVQFLIYPYYTGTLQDTILSLAEFILDRVNHDDSRAVMIAYSLFKQIRSETFTIQSMEKIIETNSNHNNKNDDSNSSGDHEESVSDCGKMIISQADSNLWEDEYFPNAIMEDNIAKTKKEKGNRKSFWNGLFGNSREKRGRSDESKYENGSNTENHISERYDGWNDKKKPDIWEEESTKRNTDIKDSMDDCEESGTFGKTVLLSRDDSYDKNITGKHILRYKQGNKEKIADLNHLPVTIGKVSDCVDIAVKDSSVSRMHAIIFEENNHIYLKDCGSTNGTYVNNVMICDDDKMPLETGDEIRLGKVKFWYE